MSLYSETGVRTQDSYKVKVFMNTYLKPKSIGII